MTHPFVKPGIRRQAKDQSIMLTAQQVNTLFSVLRSVKFHLAAYSVSKKSWLVETLEDQVAEQQKLLADLQGEATGQRYAPRSPEQYVLPIDKGDIDGRN